MTTAIKVECLHDARAQCALCSDADPRWRSWRIGMGLPAEVPEPVPDDDVFVPTMSAEEMQRWEEELLATRLTEVQCYICGGLVVWPEGKRGRAKHALCKPKQKGWGNKVPYIGRGTEGRAVRTFDANEEAAWVAKMSTPAPVKAAPVVVDQSDVYAFWDAHPEMTFREAELRLKRLRKAAV